ncbi:MAG: MBL fold metallo-hydrolase [Patescibacteria group bacterium]|jgi:competence protein ComEC|nr:MBL fold metallo-hydrolase [Patescibacteria group bacterium]
MQINFKKLYKIIGGLILVAGILIGIIVAQPRDKYLDVTALDIGQGDAILIQTPYGQDILIDGGPDNKVITRLGENMPFYDRQIDLMILTHPDGDHVTGLIEVLRRYQIDQILYTGVIHFSPAYQTWLDEIKNNQIESKIAQAGQIIDLGPDLSLEILYPEQNFNGLEMEDCNMSSIMAMLVYKDVKFLLTGDAPIEIEEQLLQQEVDLKSDVLKIGHHGSKGSTSLEFVQKVMPTCAVISVGKDNSFGHPNLRVLSNLEKVNAQILRTDEMGDIKLRSDGQEVWVVE